VGCGYPDDDDDHDDDDHDDHDCHFIVFYCMDFGLGTITVLYGLWIICKVK
jgi:hypothetical protein